MGMSLSQLSRMSAQALRADHVPELRVVIICEDLESGKYAKEVQDHLLLSLGAKIQFKPEVWTFRALQRPELQEMASKEIEQADLILFSTRGQTEMPQAIKNWLEMLVTRPARPRALVALFGREENPAQVQTSRLCLEQIAAKGRLDFFMESSAAAGPEAHGPGSPTWTPE